MFACMNCITLYVCLCVFICSIFRSTPSNLNIVLLADAVDDAGWGSVYCGVCAYVCVSGQGPPVPQGSSEGTIIYAIAAADATDDADADDAEYLNLSN